MKLQHFFKATFCLALTLAATAFVACSDKESHDEPNTFTLSTTAVELGNEANASKTGLPNFTRIKS